MYLYFNTPILTVYFIFYRSGNNTNTTIEVLYKPKFYSRKWTDIIIILKGTLFVVLYIKSKEYLGTNSNQGNQVEIIFISSVEVIT